MAETRLNVWIDNQDELNVDCDCTENYIEATDWVAPAGVHRDGRELVADDAETVFAAFVSLAAAVADVGHGDPEIDAVASPPNLTACPSELIDRHYRSAAESLARLTSNESLTYADWMRK